MLSFTYVSSLKNTFITFFFFLRGGCELEAEQHVWVHVNMYLNAFFRRPNNLQYAVNKSARALWEMKYVVDLLLTDKHG